MSAPKYIKRTQREIRKLKELSEAGIYIYQSDPSNICEFKVIIYGPKGTPYEGGLYVLSCKLSDDYPLNAPKITFLTKILHPNIGEEDGKICMDIL